MKGTMWLFIDKNSFVNSNGFFKSKKWNGRLTETSQNIDSHQNIYGNKQL
jgi:hypothetical protein